jgi:regulator of protease activity HflC (stomatin/prohibitin superfamily)
LKPQRIVSAVEVKHVDLPETMKWAMARQAESELERRAKVIHAEAEFQAAARLRDAAALVEEHPMAMQMRFLQTVTDVGSEHSNFVVLPVPIDLFSSSCRNRPFITADRRKHARILSVR